MSKYTFTTNDSERVERSDEPLEFPDTKAATDDAQIALAEMAREKLPNGKHADFSVHVENEDGKPIYQASLTFNAKTEAEMNEDAHASAAPGEAPSE